LDDIPAQRRLRKKAYKLILFTLFLFYPSVARNVLAFFSCREVNGVSYLLADFSVRCGPSDSQWSSYLPMAVVATIVYPIGIPALFLWLLWRNRASLEHSATMSWLGFVYQGYSSGLWWCEMVEMAEKLFLTSLLTFITPNKQLAAGLAVTGAYLVFLHVASPYIRSHDDRLALFAQSEIALLLLAGMVMEQDTSSADAGLNSGSLTEVLLSSLLLLVTIAVLLLFCYHALLLTKEQARLALWRTAKAAAAASAGKTLEYRNSTADVPLDKQTGSQRSLLSHTRTESEGIELADKATSA
jgi:hypothetical protein